MQHDDAMTRIATNPNVSGIRALMEYKPATGGPLSALAEALLRGPSPLSRGERELIATYVSHLNHCRFCTRSHAAFAAAQLEGGKALVDAVLSDVEHAHISPKLRALLHIAEAVQRGSDQLSDARVEAARSEGASDEEVHDTVLIASAFCMFNRYVDGLAAKTPDAPEAYEAMARVIVEKGYVR